MTLPLESVAKFQVSVYPAGIVPAVGTVKITVAPEPRGGEADQSWVCAVMLLWSTSITYCCHADACAGDAARCVRVQLEKEKPL